VKKYEDGDNTLVMMSILRYMKVGYLL